MSCGCNVKRVTVHIYFLVCYARSSYLTKRCTRPCKQSLRQALCLLYTIVYPRLWILFCRLSLDSMFFPVSWQRLVAVHMNRLNALGVNRLYHRLPRAPICNSNLCKKQRHVKFWLMQKLNKHNDAVYRRQDVTRWKDLTMLGKNVYQVLSTSHKVSMTLLAILFWIDVLRHSWLFLVDMALWLCLVFFFSTFPVLFERLHNFYYAPILEPFCLDTRPT